MLRGETGWNLPTKPLTHKHHLFVCSHKARDIRCGECGPKVYEAILKEITERKLKNEVEIAQCSHVGGHEYAGNLLCYPNGDWFGRLTAEDIPSLFDEYISKGKILTTKWRGRMGLSKTEQDAFIP
eukprot:TRINITY_DN10093_c0_g1_i2.p1 TRINITY_DN10093_c0_g1~~TRINITY_DN10093_c0_g1_i2.p1  ORF type:complete len:126 (+),score=21.94 TRINITY_DN10093_c0_g1_i2:349-726(+)